MGCEKEGVKVNTKVFGPNNQRTEFSSLEMGRPMSGTYYEEKKRGLVLDIFHSRCLLDNLVRLLSRQAVGYMALQERDLRYQLGSRHTNSIKRCVNIHKIPNENSNFKEEKGRNNKGNWQELINKGGGGGRKNVWCSGSQKWKKEKWGINYVKCCL